MRTWRHYEEIRIRELLFKLELLMLEYIKLLEKLNQTWLEKCKKCVPMLRKA